MQGCRVNDDGDVKNGINFQLGYSTRGLQIKIIATSA
jgi:hypothetical protein